MKTPIAFQLGLDGGAIKEVAWQSIILRAIEEEGYESDLLETEYNKKIFSRVLAMLPATEKIARKIMGMSDVRVAVSHIAGLALLPNTEWIHAETFARGLRKVKEGLELKYGHRELVTDVVTLDDGEEYYSSLEEKFIGAVKEAHRSYSWKTNVMHVVRHPLYKDRVVRPDLVCEDLGLWIELDGYEYHQGRDKFTADRQRAIIAQLEGYYYLAFSGEQISVPGGVENALRVITSFIEKTVGVRSF